MPLFGDAFKLIRFAAMMTIEEFTKCLNENSILKSEEIIQIFKSIADCRSPCEFSRIKREPYGKKSIIFSGNEKDSYYYRNSVFCSFTVNKPIELFGFYLYGWIAEESRETQHFAMLLESDEKLIDNQEFSIYMNGTDFQPNLFCLHRPQYLEPNKKYKISIHGFEIKKWFYCFKSGPLTGISYGVKFEMDPAGRSIMAGLYFER